MYVDWEEGHHDVAAMIPWTCMCLLELYYLYVLSGFINNVMRPPTFFKVNSAEVCSDADFVRRRTRANRFPISGTSGAKVCGLQTFVQEHQSDSIRIWYHG
jgi:hypothetical protein